MMPPAFTLVVRLGSTLATKLHSDELEPETAFRVEEQLSASISTWLCALYPGSPGSVKVRIASHEDKPSRFLYHFELGDTQLFGPLGEDKSGASDKVVDCLLAALQRHRARLLFLMLKEACWQQVQQKAEEAGVDQNKFDAFIESAANRGLGIGDAINKIRNLLDNGLNSDSFDRQSEAILSAIANPSILSLKLSKLDNIKPDTHASLSAIRDQLFNETGVLFPKIEFNSDQNTEPNSAEQLPAEGFKVRINNHTFSDCPQTGETIEEALKRKLMSLAALFVDMSAADASLGRLANSYPELVSTTIESVGTFEVLRVLRLLVEEFVDIRDLSVILETLQGIRGGRTERRENQTFVLPYDAVTLKPCTGSDVAQIYADRVRIELRHQISQRCADKNRVVHYLRTGPSFESLLSKFDETSTTNEDTVYSLYSALVSGMNTAPLGTVILTSSSLRKKLWRLTHLQYPLIKVLCEDEQSEYFTFISVGTIEPITIT